MSFRFATAVLAAAGLAISAAPAAAQIAPVSNAFSTAWVEEKPSVHVQSSDGDLWPTCWSNDDNLYTSNGDGFGFSGAPSDIAVSRLSGSPENGTLAGATLTRGDQVTRPAPSGYSRKPTGMVCVDGALYLAVQDLSLDFNRVDGATIVKSTNKGATWTRTSDRMFTGAEPSTIFFLDYGKDSADNPTPNYVYAYALERNWRDSFSGVVADPQSLYLARIPKASIQDKSTWQWSTGLTTWGAAGDTAARVPVLTDTTRRYPDVRSANVENMSTLSQGHVVWNKGLQKYLYASWTEYTWEFYEAPTPQGPWKRFLDKDFGGYPWSDGGKRGGYGTIIPSKFISADGRRMWVQSNVCDCGGAATGQADYRWSMRRMELTPQVATTPSNARSDSNNLARTTTGVRPLARVAHFGNIGYLNDGRLDQSEDDWNDEVKPTDGSFWGYAWPRTYNLNRVVFRTGTRFGDGGWFASGLRVQVRNNNVWTNVSGQTITPSTYSSAAGFTNVVIRFSDTTGDGVRVIGTAGGTQTFTSISELQVYYGTAGGNAPASLAADGGFEGQTTGSLSGAWRGQGPDVKGVDRNLGFQRTGLNNAWIHPTNNLASTAWNAILQTVTVAPNTNYVLRGWVQTSNNITGYFGVRRGTSETDLLAETSFTNVGPWTPVSVSFNSGSQTQLTIFAGYWGPGSDAFLRLDDVELTTP